LGEHFSNTKIRVSKNITKDSFLKKKLKKPPQLPVMKGNLEHAAQVPVLGFLGFDGLTLYGQHIR